MKYDGKSFLIKILFLGAFFGLLYLVLLYKLYYLLDAAPNLYFGLYTVLISAFLLSRFIIAFFYEDPHRRKFSDSSCPSVSFVVPCKDDDGLIAKTIRSCAASVYPGKVECIAVDDGSVDKTLAEMKKSQKKYGSKVKVISFSRNRGKREAMAEGVLAAKGEIIVFVDSDSFVDKDSVKHLVDHFLSDPKVGAVSGNSMVENAKANLLTKMQSARYGIAFDIFKACESVFGTVTCCPGCFSAYRKEAILPVLERWRNQTFLGTRGTFGDDRSLTNFVLETWKVIYCRKATATTTVPETYRKFLKQQLRWKKSWIREGARAGSFFWKKNPIASAAFYINLLIPILGPVIILKVFVFDVIIDGRPPVFFLSGVLAMSLLFGLYYYLIYPNRYWWCILLFTPLYMFVLIWQMPYAIFKLRDSSWGTR